ncbi:AraC family transcriptional regulator [Chitinophaga sp. Cy-1792]|uniref:helix-turn-helix domain-containing protein n=1 Tax=Chitinophaga sp. Cy-1792 TaxID=2608339 RepID=UPI001423693D|nr:helix-turn-helix transcriptional regulator [Chitinophaga sp. Cy-1792]NIG54079.1 helix-turn-helix transcriptional regulator [Chitinophaga sp. Cy-1792]
MKKSQPLRIKTISEFHALRHLPKPAHPLISVIRLDETHAAAEEDPVNIVFDFYIIALKRNFNVKFRYGQQQYDFNEGVLCFMSPGQVFGVGETTDANDAPRVSGWMLCIHPDFLWHTPLATNIRKYEFFDYAVHEALFLSDKEENTLIGIMENIQQEYLTNIDKFSQHIIIAQLEVLLNYADRFYNRQFLTRKIANHRILDSLEAILEEYFNSDQLPQKGLPGVKEIAAKLNLSPNYLSTLLKVMTGRNTQQHIQDKMMEKAKEKISSTTLSVSEIAYELGFDHPQSFSRLFKSRTGLSPLEFRASFR